MLPKSTQNRGGHRLSVAARRLSVLDQGAAKDDDDKGWQYLTELVATERDVVNKLRSVTQQVLVPLHRALGEGQAILSLDEIKSVFGSFELLSQTNESFLKTLQDLHEYSSSHSNNSSTFLPPLISSF